MNFFQLVYLVGIDAMFPYSSSAFLLFLRLLLSLVALHALLHPLSLFLKALHHIRDVRRIHACVQWLTAMEKWMGFWLQKLWMNIPTHVLLSKVSRLPFFLWLLTCWSNPFICNSNVSCCYPILHIIWVFWECLTTPASSHLTCQVGLFQQITPRCIHTSKALRAHTACMQEITDSSMHEIQPICFCKHKLDLLWSWHWQKTQTLFSC